MMTDSLGVPESGPNPARRLRVLVSAYACQPGRGSEPGVGWNVVREMAKRHDVWVLTRPQNQRAIEAEMAIDPAPGLTFSYYGLPSWANRWLNAGLGVQFHYYLWQLGVISTARELNQKIQFDLGHHVTYVRYWSPSFLAFLPIPFVWGPIGGGESAPGSFRSEFGFRGRLFEWLRDVARWLGEHDPLVRLTARRASSVLATTQETAERLHLLGSREVALLPEAALDLNELPTYESQPNTDSNAVFLSIGRLLSWKGFHLGLRAFAEARLPSAEYWIIGAGPERNRLEALSSRLGVAGQVRFLGQLPREQVLAHLSSCTALVHPSLHDSGGWVCLEAMSVGKPVICLDLGGPAIQVTSETGIKVPSTTPGDAVKGIAKAMSDLVSSGGLRRRMGVCGELRVRDQFTWHKKADFFDAVYSSVLRGRSDVR